MSAYSCHTAQTEHEMSDFSADKCIFGGLTSLSTYCTGYITMGSFKDRENKYILACQDSAL